MRCHLKNAIKDKVLQRNKEAVCPIPGQVRDDSMSIDLDPDVEEHQSDTSRAPEAEPEYSLAVLPVWRVEPGDSAKEVRQEVIEQDDVDHVSEQDPDIPFSRHGIKLVVLAHLDRNLTLDPFLDYGSLVFV